MPAEAAEVVRQALRKATENGDVGDGKWRLVEMLAADYLAG